MSQVNEKAFQLIQEAHQHCFCDNCYQDQYGTFSRVSPAMSAWLIDVENFILSNYGRSSVQWNNFNRLDRQKLSGYYEEDFEKQKAIIISALQACIRSEPQQSQRHKEQRNKFDSTAIPLQLYIFGPHLAVIAILVSVLGVYNYCNRENRVCHRAQEQHKDNNTAETLAIMQPSKEAAVIETQEFKLYQIVDKEDFSYRAPNGQLVVRKDYRILLMSADTTRNQIQSIAKNIATMEKEVDALIVYFFWPGTEPTGAYTAAMATYAPNGRWADAKQSAPKELVMEYGRTETELTPQYRSDTGLQSAPRRKKIYWDLVKEEDRADMADGDYEQSKRTIAKRYGLSVSEVAKIQVEGVDKRWPIPEEPRY